MSILSSSYGKNLKVEGINLPLIVSPGIIWIISTLAPMVRGVGGKREEEEGKGLLERREIQGILTVLGYSTLYNIGKYCVIQYKYKVEYHDLGKQ